jgi:cell division septation protein DedD
MFNYNRTIIALVLCFAVAGCSKSIIYLKSELKARDHMSRAAELEESMDYFQAAQEYAFVAEHYPSTSYYQTAVRKAAFLNIHPSNSKMDFNEALKWLRVYSTLSIFHQEKESIQSNIALVKYIKQLQIDFSKVRAERDRILAENDNLLSVALKQSDKIETSTHQIEDLEKTLSQVQDQLDEMKKVDLQIYSDKASGHDSNPAEPGQKTTEFSPEAYSSVTSTAHAEEVYSKPTVITKKIVAPQINSQAKVQDSAEDIAETKNPSFYPYTIQISSFFQKEDAIHAATELREKGNLSFTSPALIPGKGRWYRVFIGSYESLREAKKTALELKKQKHPHAFVSELPFVIQIETADFDEDLDKAKAGLQSKGYLAYSIPDRVHDNNALLIGAFRTEKEAAKQAWNPQLTGFKPRVVRR